MLDEYNYPVMHAIEKIEIELSNNIDAFFLFVMFRMQYGGNIRSPCCIHCSILFFMYTVKSAYVVTCSKISPFSYPVIENVI